MLNLKLSSASCDKIQRAGNQVKAERRLAKWFAIDFDHSWTRSDGQRGGPTMVTLSNAVTAVVAEDVGIH